jgi:hypothetical protein
MFSIKAVKNMPKVRAREGDSFGIIVSPFALESAIILKKGKDKPALAGGLG